MTDQDHDNIDLFRTDFVSGKNDFAAWLDSYLSQGAIYPFLMGGPQQYDLGDLLRALLPSAKKTEHELLQTAFQKQLAATAHSFNLEGLRILSHALARSGFSSVTFDLANAIETLLLKLGLAGWSDKERAHAFLAIDQTIAALAAFAIDGDVNAKRVSRMVFEQNVLAPFASSLFAPLALSNIKSWPIFWRQLLNQATRMGPLFEPNPQWQNDELGLVASHFDVLHVFEDFLEQADAREYTLQEVYDALQADLDDLTEESAHLALCEMEKRGRIIRRASDDYDELYLTPRSTDLKRKTPKRQREKAAIVEPVARHDWSAAKGRLPSDLVMMLENNPATHHELQYG
jgi:hypothetical protein